MKDLLNRTILFALLLCTSFFQSASTFESPVFSTYGVKINVTDLKAGVEFYCDKLGFTIESATDQVVYLKTGQSNKLMLNEVKLIAPGGEQDARAGLSLQVNHLDSTIQRLKARGLSFGSEQIRREAVGDAVYVTDPFGTRISLMHQTIVSVPHFDEPRIYNFGFRIPDMARARTFYCDGFGFVVRSEKYLPLDLPLGHTDGTFAFMLHFREGVKPIRFNMTDNERVVILFQTDNLERAMKVLKEKGVMFQQSKPIESKSGRYISFYDPFGYLSELIEVK